MLKLLSGEVYYAFNTREDHHKWDSLEVSIPLPEDADSWSDEEFEEYLITEFRSQAADAFQNGREFLFLGVLYFNIVIL